jgi:hypothetical protein
MTWAHCSCAITGSERQRQRQKEREKERESIQHEYSKTGGKPEDAKEKYCERAALIYIFIVIYNISKYITKY